MRHSNNAGAHIRIVMFLIKVQVPASALDLFSDWVIHIDLACRSDMHIMSWRLKILIFVEVV